ncbi:leucine--tRNA ligase [Candidatus Saccharibacteria bacterium]|nr:leucine--tRNA ligase [Candidatus Saccharibacteria bacterium]
MNRYNPKNIEPKWQQIWTENHAFAAIDYDDRPKYVMLTEFPYPSGTGIHMGHTREYTYGDIMARHKRAQGYNVLFPMGYDEFGLPTENYAIKNKVSPQAATQVNVANFQKQMESLGLSVDWSRSVHTSDPEYYKWTQWLFLKFYAAGMAYQDEIAINWCPHCKTGLSNEEVINGRHERCDTLVEKKLLKQWILRITKYADRLIAGLKDVDYPSRIADQQINWIGRSKGAEITWKVCDRNGDETGDSFETFTTRKDTIPGVTFIVIAPESALLDTIMAPDHAGRVGSYRQTVSSMTDIERQEDKSKSGVFVGGYAKNPFNDQVIPVYAASYVLAGYGTGAVMGMPGHDLRDREFAIKHDIPVVFTTSASADYQDTASTHVYTGSGTQINSGEPYDGLANRAAGDQIFEKLVSAGPAVEKINYKLRDWVFSRQHYWGEPIPIIHCLEHGAVAVPEAQLPVVLPPVDHYEPTDTGESPLVSIRDWVETTCPACGKPAEGETDTMPNWAGSSWYYLRYFDARNNEQFADPKKLDYWGQVDMYLGGMEHTTLHLLYSRFWHEFLYDQGMVPTKEPYAARRGQGIIQAVDGTKMSKSKGNVISPTDVIASGYGADALRLSIAFLAPYDQTTPWNPESVAGTHRFLQRLWTLTQEFLDSETLVGNLDDTEAQADIMRAVHAAIKKVSADLDTMSFNTAIAAQMEALNQLYKLKDQDGFASVNAWRSGLENMVKLIAPFAPHFAEELWQQIGHEQSIHLAGWPAYDEQYLVMAEQTIGVQINGKIRSEITVATGADEQTIVSAAQSDPRIIDSLAGSIVRKTIYVPGKLINFVV